MRNHLSNLTAGIFIFYALSANIPTFGNPHKYYFSSSQGDDSRTTTQAQNPNTPWKTLNKLNSFFANLSPGDYVLFKRGDTFYGSITIKTSGTSSLPIVINANGTGTKPIISGLVTFS